MSKKIYSTLILFFLFLPFTSAFTINGGLTVNGSTTLGIPLTVANGGTGVTASKLAVGEARNCGISVSGSTFTISQADGNSLSSLQPCKIGIKSNTAGRVIEAAFVSNVSFTFGASSDTDGNDWGITNTADWSNTMPFFLGVIYNGATPYFTISRVPKFASGSASADLCQKGDTDCDGQADAMILTTGLTLSSFINLPITQVGWFQMAYATSGAAWTASTSIHTGFNSEFEKIPFFFPTGQMGAASAKFTSGNGPLFFNQNCIYYIFEDGTFDVSISLDTVFTNGSDASASHVAIPYKTYLGALPIGILRTAATDRLPVFQNISNTSLIDLYYFSAISTTVSTANNGFTNSGDYIQFTMRAETLH